MDIGFGYDESDSFIDNSEAVSSGQMLKPPLSDYSPYRSHACFTQVFFFSAATACHSMMSSSQLVSPPDMEASTSTLELSSSGQPLMREITRMILRTMVLKPRCVNPFDDPYICFVPTVLQKTACFLQISKIVQYMSISICQHTLSRLV